MAIINQKILPLNNTSSGATDLTAIIKSLSRKAGENGQVTLAIGIAKRILDELNFSGQRRIKKARVAERLKEIRNGSWEAQISVVVLVELPDGSMQLIDGQHRLTAIVEHGVGVATCIKIIAARNEEDVRRFYAKYDMKGAGRSEAELLSASGLAAELEVRPATATGLLKAVSIIENGMEPNTKGEGKEHLAGFDFRLGKAYQWDAEARAFDEIIDKADTFLKRKLLRAGTMAVALYTLKHSRIKALEFWTGVAENDGLRKLDSRARLIADLSNRALTSGNIRQSVQQSTVAWNAFFQGRNLSIIKCLDGAAIVIEGTPLRKGGSR
ncbi:hypothetical protein PS870_01700 [Pseudomonas fluorescens]|uniref:ParB/Sulfiredoxin domain-containing protein n=1 Tax=Pseudomonas fluorescens TaxID=294 RepID=A0A5E7J7G9_PSEFL|nr:hypothetical protein [Pseudomonas fluorescens]VVO79203.1 hypothetical protein PS870_01700 [Pseudomonas fluorescens]